MKNILIIGNSAAGIAAAEAIKERDKESSITVISDEESLPYFRYMISDYLSGKVTQEQIRYKSGEFFSENNIQIILNKKVIRINLKKNQVVTEDKNTFNYDCLLLANGASPEFPDIKGNNKKGVFGFRSIKDVKEILELVQISDTVCVLGGGIAGLSAACALKQRGLDTKVIVKSNHILPQIIDEQAADLFRKKFEENDIEIITNIEAEEVLGNGDVKAIKLDSGKVIGCQIVIIAKGDKPNVKIAEDIQITIDKGICVDEHMRTNISNIYAAGDVCKMQNASSSLWTDALEQGRVAGCNILGEDVRYESKIPFNSAKFFGIPVVSIGAYEYKDKYEVIIKSQVSSNVYKKLLVEGDYLVGAILVGNIDKSEIFSRLIKDKINIGRIKDRLLSDNLDYQGIEDLNKEEDKIYV